MTFKAIPLALNSVPCYKFAIKLTVKNHTMPNNIPQIIPAEKIQTYSRYFIEEFVSKTVAAPSYEIDLSFYPTRTDYEANTGRVNGGPVYSEQHRDRFTIHICEEPFENIPSPALQGWMEYEAMRCVQKLRPELNGFNFRKNILPLMPVTGLAENHIRELVASLEGGIAKYLATKTLTHMGGGFQQAHFYFFRISPIVDDRGNYQKTLPHPWTKALFLCRKFRELMPIYWLADQNVEFSQDLASYWWKVHDYLMPEDKTFLKKLASIPHQYADAPYPDIVIALFKKLKSQYLLSHKDISKPASPPSTLH